MDRRKILYPRYYINALNLKQIYLHQVLKNGSIIVPLPVQRKPRVLMRFHMKQRVSSFLLLSVILPMLLLAPFHRHAEVPRDDLQCESCSQHLPHPGHLTSRSCTDECLICRLLCQQFSPSDNFVESVLTPERTPDSGFCSDDVPNCFTRHSSPRAPPVSFCF